MCNPVSLVEHEHKQQLDSPHRLCVNLWITPETTAQMGFLGANQALTAAHTALARTSNSG